MEKLTKTLERLMMFFFLTLMFCFGMFICYLIFICTEYIHITNIKANELLPTFTKGISILIMICASFLYLFLSVSLIKNQKL